MRTGCRSTRVIGRAGDGPEGVFYRIDLAAEPVEGRANAELSRFLGGEFGVGSCSVEIRSGKSSRRKLVRISEPETIPGWFGG